MAVLNLRGLPKELVALVKAQAALDGETILQWVRRVLEAQFGAEASVSIKAPTAEIKASVLAHREADEGWVQENGVVVNDTSDRMVRRDAAVAEAHHETNGGRNPFNQDGRRSAIRSNAGRESMAVPTAKAKGQLTAEEFMSLSSSEQLRARREGKF